MLKKQLPVYPGVGLGTNGYWSNSTRDNDYWDLINRPMVVYSNYTTGDTHDTIDEYEMGFDKFGPQFYTPTHCM